MTQVMRVPPRQLALDLSLPESLSRDDFLVSDSNEAALTMVESWPDWPAQVLALCGPPGSGRSHLGAIWAELSGARRLSARELEIARIPTALATNALLLEDVDAQVPATAMFHLLNAAREQGAFLLLTVTEHPSSWVITLPDLVSRLRAVPVVMLEPPDDGLLRAILVKLAMDRQLLIDAETIEYCARRMDRSLSAARSLITALDSEGLETGRRVTRQLASRVLDRFGWR